MDLTREQKEIIKSNAKITLVNAYAGTGKTSTLVEYCKARVDSKILYLAYNSSMSKEAQKKFSSLPNVHCTTIHSLAFQSLKRELEPYKDRLGNQNLKSVDILHYFSGNKHQYYYANLLLSLFRNFINSNNTIEELLQNLNSDEKKVGQFLPRLWADIMTNKDMPFEHDFYLKIFQLSKPNLGHYNYILVDEAQDLNPVMFDIVYSQKSNQVYIGDTFQKIYGFRQCVNALEVLKEHKESKIFYLTRTFRCPSYIVECANPYLFLLGAEKPLVGNDVKFNSDLLPNYENKECIICRTNAKVFDYVVSNPDIKFHFVGGIKGYNFSDILDIALLHSKNLENRKFIKNPFYNKFLDSSELREHIKKSNDVEAKTRLMIFYKYAKTHNLFKIVKDTKHYSLNQADFIITSAHKSKGLEWDFVRIEDDFINLAERLETAKKRKRDCLDFEAEREEIHLLYVALTRAKKKITAPDDYILNIDQVQEMSEHIKLIDL